MNTILYIAEELQGEPYLEAKIKKMKTEPGGEVSEIRWVALTVSVEQLDGIWKSGLVPQECLMIAARDSTLSWAKQQKLATVAYCNPNYPDQSYVGADLIAEGFEEIDEEYLKRIWQRAHGIPWTIFTTDRCLVRELCLEDLQGLFELYAQPGLTDYMEKLYPWEKELEYQRAYIASMYRFYEYGMWLVFDKRTGELIGRAGLEHRAYPGDVLELEMGYAITPSRQHQGYATEVCRAILDYAGEKLTYPRVNCLIEKDNVFSIRLMDKLGFQYMDSTDISGSRMERYTKEL